MTHPRSLKYQSLKRHLLVYQILMRQLLTYQFLTRHLVQNFKEQNLEKLILVLLNVIWACGAICSYHVNEQDNVRRVYINMGPYQPKLKDKEYPRSLYGKQYHWFQYSWFAWFSWLEYSCATDKKFCFPCFSFWQWSTKISDIYCWRIKKLEKD